MAQARQTNLGLQGSCPSCMSNLLRGVVVLFFLYGDNIQDGTVSRALAVAILEALIGSLELQVLSVGGGNNELAVLIRDGVPHVLDAR